MYRMMVVDDDMIVRMYLKDMIRWEEYGFCVVETARDGVEALELVRRAKPEVILTDISMPRMDGIELIRRLRQDGYQGVINVLSCHDDFEFVRSAMQVGADDYLLKNHLNPETTNEVLQKMTQQIQTRLHETGKRNEMERLVSKGIDVVQREFLETILNGSGSAALEEHQIKEAKLKGTYRRLYAVMIQAACADRNQVRELKSLFAQRLKQEPADLLFFRDDILVLLIDLTDIPSLARSQEILVRLKRIANHIAKQYLNIELSMAVSAVCDGKHAIADALWQAKSLLENRFYGAGDWQYGSEQSTAYELPQKAEVFQENLLKWLEAAEEEQIQQIFYEACQEIKTACVCPELVQGWIRQCDYNIGMTRTKEQQMELRFFENYQTLAEAYIGYWRANHLQVIPKNLSPSMMRAVQYVQKHFCESIGLNDAAREADLSPAYFSTSFKKEMGIGFSEYLLELRLKRVCVKLRTSGTAIKQIALESGFFDYPYFCRIFKRNIGMSPAAYRKDCVIF